MNTMGWFWVVLGALLIVAELLVPGLVVVFLGAAALLVALAAYLGIITSWTTALIAWMILSMALVLFLRGFFARFLPGETRKGNLDEDVEAFGVTVRVVGVDESDPRKGRVSYRGSTWAAESADEPLVVDGTVRLLARENLVWMVEPTDGELD